MRTPVSTTAIEDAQTAGAAVRALNHSTINTGQALDDFWPSDIYNIVGELASLAHRLPQALSQLTAIMASLQAAGRLGHDEGTTVDAEFIARLADHLAAAGERAGAMGADLDAAHSLLAHLQYHESSSEP